MIDYDYAASRLNYDPATGHFTWKPKTAECGERYWRRWNTRYANKVAGSALNICVGKGPRKTRKTYIRIHFEDRDYLAHRVAWLLTHGEWPAGEIDHIDGDSTNNAISNLRDCSRAANAANQNLSQANSTGYKGVSLHKCGRYYAQVKVAGKHVLAKTFPTAEEAARAYDAAALQHFGEFARLNFPEAR